MLSGGTSLLVIFSINCTVLVTDFNIVVMGSLEFLTSSTLHSWDNLFKSIAAVLV